MSIDFPAGATTGTIFTAAGSSWRYDGTKWVAYGAGSGNAGRNLIHNSMFNIAQRGVGPFTTAPNNLDRWSNGSGGSDAPSYTRSNLNDTDRTQISDEAATYALVNAFTGNSAAGSFHFIGQKIEQIYRLAGKTVTVSFWAKAAAGTPKLGINVLLVYGTGGSPSAAIWVLATGNSVTLSTTWARYTTTIAVPSMAGKTLGTNGDDYTELTFWYSSGSGNAALAGNIGVQSGTISLWGVQLEIGSQATPLEKPDPRYDLANCQRFYSVVPVHALGTAGGASFYLSVNAIMPVTMRAAPTLASVQTLAADTNLGGAVNLDSATSGGFRAYSFSAAASTFSFDRLIGASADL